MCEWKSSLNRNYQCNVPPEPGSKYCIFHQSGRKDTKRFVEQFYTQIYEREPSPLRNPRCEFDGYIFPVTLIASDSAHEAGLTRWTDRVFLPKHISGRLMCTEAVFKRSVILKDIDISDDAFFWGAKFEHYANFINSRMREAVFDNTQFEKGVMFSLAKVGSMSFRNARIAGEANFTNSRIGRFIAFNNAQIKGDLRFSNVQIGGDAIFQRTTISGTASFNRTVIGGKAHFEHCQAHSIWLGVDRPTIRWSPKYLRNLALRCGIDLRDGELAPIFWRFASQTFEKEGLKDRVDACHYFERLWKMKPQKLEHKRQEFSMRYDEERHIELLRSRKFEVPEDKPDKPLSIAELLWRKKSLACSVILRAGWLKELIFRWLPDCIFLRWPAAYGASFSRLAATWAFLIGGFSATYYLLTAHGFRILEGASLAVPFSNSFTRALYFSVITFVTLGYGDVHPAPGLGAALAATEAVLGSIALVFTVLVIGHKFMR